MLRNPRPYKAQLCTRCFPTLAGVLDSQPEIERALQPPFGYTPACIKCGVLIAPTPQSVPTTLPTLRWTPAHADERTYAATFARLHALATRPTKRVEGCSCSACRKRRAFHTRLLAFDPKRFGADEHVVRAATILGAHGEGLDLVEEFFKYQTGGVMPLPVHRALLQNVDRWPEGGLHVAKQGCTPAAYHWKHGQWLAGHMPKWARAHAGSATEVCSCPGAFIDAWRSGTITPAALLHAFPYSSVLTIQRLLLNARILIATYAGPDRACASDTSAIYVAWGKGFQTLARMVIAGRVVPGMKGLLGWLRYRVPDNVCDARIYLKALSACVRRGQVLHPAWPSELTTQTAIYLDQLLGRYPDATGEARAEVATRTQPLRPQLALDLLGHATQAEFQKQISYAIDEAIARWPEPMSLDGVRVSEYVLGLFSEATGGASDSATKPLTRPALDGTPAGQSKATKALRLSQMSTEDWCEALNAPRSMRSTALAKLEAGARNRLLIPGADGTWLVSVFAGHHGETAYYRREPRLALIHRTAEDQLIYGRLLDATRGDGMVVCSDYSDFNHLHSYDLTMARWCKKIARHYWPDLEAAISPVRAHTPAARAIAHAWLWFAAALTDARVRDGAGASHKFDHGLWTGWRFTTFFNSMLNLAYHKAIQATVTRITGLPTEPTHHYALGDDSIMRFSSWRQGLIYLGVIDKMGLSASADKQLADPFTGEFLRLMYKGGALVEGSLLRALTGLVSHDLQAPALVTRGASLPALAGQMTILVRRGADPEALDALYEAVAYDGLKRAYRHLDLPTPPKSLIHTITGRLRATGPPQLVTSDDYHTRPMLTPETQRIKLKEVELSRPRVELRAGAVLTDAVYRGLAACGLTAHIAGATHDALHTVASTGLPSAWREADARRSDICPATPHRRLVPGELPPPWLTDVALLSPPKLREWLNETATDGSVLSIAASITRSRARAFGLGVHTRILSEALRSEHTPATALLEQHLVQQPIAELYETADLALRSAIRRQDLKLDIPTLADTPGLIAAVHRRILGRTVPRLTRWARAMNRRVTMADLEKAAHWSSALANLWRLAEPLASIVHC